MTSCAARCMRAIFSLQFLMEKYFLCDYNDFFLVAIVVAWSAFSWHLSISFMHFMQFNT